ncbi:MAG: TonB family protein [Deltaproteobacteria bacterium]|nr:TonB family protein [Deltaproteobacteria bacterium]MBN2672566.1 TonB family protein [Deltaproteobacteria bacterium]
MTRMPNFILLCGILLVQPARAQSPGNESAASPSADSVASDTDTASADSGLVPPTLVTYVDAPYPEAEFEQGIEAAVLAELEIDAEGHVTNVTVVESAGEVFDTPAAAAMKQFVFSPATQNGVATPCILMYRYKFFIQKETPADTDADADAEPAATAATLQGTLKDFDDAPLVGAYVALIPVGDQWPEGKPEVIETETDDAGNFIAQGIPAGTYRLSLAAVGYKKYEVEETLTADEQRDVTYRLETINAEYEVVVRAKREKPAREVTRRTVSREVITQIPGTGGDALRAVQNLPGMALANFMGGELVIRGSSHADSGFFFDSLRSPLLYHFGGLTSIVNSDLIESIDYYPGNFSVRYGRATGGAIDVNTKTPNTERYHGYIDVDAFDGGLLFEGPIGKNWSIAVSGRRSWIDVIMNNVDMFGDSVQMTVAPRYYDFQVLADYHPSKNNNLKLFFFASDDRWEMNWDDSPNWEGGLDLHIWVYQAQVEWMHRFSEQWQNTFNLGFGTNGVSDVEGEMSLTWNIYPLILRDEVTWTPNEKFTLRLGTDSEFNWAKLDAYVPGDIDVEGDTYDAERVDQWYELTGNRFYYSPSLYAEADLQMIPKTEVILGLRSDYFSSVDAWGVDPRLTARYHLFEKTTLKGGVGLFHQAPSVEYIDRDYGNPDLDLIRAVHYSLGVEQDFTPNLNLSVEGFYKDLDNVMTASNDMIVRDGETVPERFDSDGVGRVYGMEMMLKHKETERFFGWVSYTLMKSERRDEAGGDWRPFDYDQRHILTAVGSLKFGRGFTAGLRFRLVSGTPTDRIVGAGYDADRNEYFPIYDGNNAGRTPTFHQLDLRFEKKWQGNPLAFTVYMDIQNVYNHKNVAGTMYNYDYSEQGHFYDLPFLPSLGMKLEY